MEETMRYLKSIVALSCLCVIVAVFWVGAIELSSTRWDRGRWTPEVGPVFTPHSHSATLSIPNTFVGGQTIFASQMNANFTAIRDVVNNLDDANYANDSMTASSKIIDGTIDLAAMGTDSVDASKIKALSVDVSEMILGATQNMVFTNKAWGTTESNCVEGSIDPDICEAGELTLTTRAGSAGPVLLLWGFWDCTIGGTGNAVNVHLERGDVEFAVIDFDQAGDSLVQGWFVDTGASAATATKYEILLGAEAGATFNCTSDTQYFLGIELRNDS
jgi:hypothetical protein